MNQEPIGTNAGLPSIAILGRHRPLYRRIQQVVEDSGFGSSTDFIVYVLRDLMGETPSQEAPPTGTGPDFTQDELDAVRRKLKNLGYL